MDSPTPVRRDLIQALIAILSQGIQDDALDDAEKLLDTIRSLSPNLDGLGEFTSYIAIKRGRVQEALQAYAAAPANDSKWYVMMALCLKLSGDPTWHWHAEQALERRDTASRYAHNLANILLGRDSSEPAAAPPAPPPVQAMTHGYVNYLSV